MSEPYTDESSHLVEFFNDETWRTTIRRGIDHQMARIAEQVMMGDFLETRSLIELRELQVRYKMLKEIRDTPVKALIREPL